MLIIIILAIVSAVSFGLYKYYDSHSYYFDDACIACNAVFGFSTIILVLLVLIIVITHLMAPGDLAANTARRESLVYQIENSMYTNNNDIGKKELYDEVREFNEDLARGKANVDNIWVGVFYPDELYENLELIDLP